MHTTTMFFALLSLAAIVIAAPTPAVACDPVIRSVHGSMVARSPKHCPVLDGEVEPGKLLFVSDIHSS